MFAGYNQVIKNNYRLQIMIITYLKLPKINPIQVLFTITWKDNPNWRINRNYSRIWKNIILNRLDLTFLRLLLLTLSKNLIRSKKIFFNSSNTISPNKIKTSKSNPLISKITLLTFIYQISKFIKLYKVFIQRPSTKRDNHNNQVLYGYWSQPHWTEEEEYIYFHLWSSFQNF